MVTLSLSGKEVVIKVTASVVPTYTMMCFKFHVTLCKEINGDKAKFW